LPQIFQKNGTFEETGASIMPKTMRQLTTRKNAAFSTFALKPKTVRCCLS